MAGGPILRPGVMEYFKQHPGQIVKLDDLVEALNAPALSIQKCINNMMRSEPGMPLVIEQPGQAWSYDNNGRRNIRRRKFYEIGTSSKGNRIVIEDEQGTLYVAMEVAQ